MRRWQLRCSRAISWASSSGSPRSQPSGDNQGHGAASQHPSGPAVVESLEGVADAGAPGPVGNGPGDLADRLVDAAVVEVAGDAGQAGGEQEGLHPVQVASDDVTEVEQQTGVAFHRAADVADEHQGAGFVPGLAVGQVPATRRRSAGCPGESGAGQGRRRRRGSCAGCDDGPGPRKGRPASPWPGRVRGE